MNESLISSAMRSFKKNGFDRSRSRSDERSSRGEFNERKPSRFRSDFDNPRSTPFVRTSKGPLELFDATCDKCGAQCELPFKPRGGKPVYCRDCFRKKDSYDSADMPSQRANSPEQLNEINMKLDKILRAMKLD